MIWKNPFLIKNSEQQETEGGYLALFDPAVLDMIGQENLEKVNFIDSTPGAGKTSLFRAFSPKVLSTIAKDAKLPQYNEIYKNMSKLGAVRGNQVTLLTAIISCARGYSILDEMFNNGRRKQVLFALLNYRIVIAFIKGICNLFEYDIEELKEVKFEQIPQELLSNVEAFDNAYSTFEWACNGEKELCRFLDSEESESIPIPLIHTTLSLVKLFEAGNIIINGEKYFDSSVIIFDDFHKLTSHQREAIREAIITLKSCTGIWLGQRLEGWNRKCLISDGSLYRDYNNRIVIDNYWVQKRDTFYKMLESIANKRIKESNIIKTNLFKDMLQDSIEIKDYKKILSKYIEEIKMEIFAEGYSKYSEVISFVESEPMNIYEKAIYFECIKIKINREKYGQLSFDFGQKVKIEEMNEFYLKNKDGGEFYLCIKCKIPFFYGLEKMKSLSSYNIEQFLYFCSMIFDTYKVKSIGISNKRNKGKKLTAKEQESVLKKCVLQKWNDMDYRYRNIEEIKGFIKMISTFCISSRDDEKNSYAGGAYTGFGLKATDISELVNNKKYDNLSCILAQCLASKYFEKRDNIRGDITVFYLNRWICMYYGLPLAYGGWREVSIEKLYKSFEQDYRIIKTK